MHKCGLPTPEALYSFDARGIAKRFRHAAIFGAFALDGPEKCSGLPVMRHDAASLAAELGPGFELLDQRRHDHRTPGGATQNFQFSTFRRAA